MQNSVLVYVEENQPNNYDELLRCGHLVYTDESGEERIQNDLLDSSGYYSREDLVREVVGILGVSEESVWLIE